MLPLNHHTGIHKIAPHTFFYLSVRDGKDCFTFEPTKNAPLTEALHYAKQFAQWGHNTVAELRKGEVHYRHEILTDGRKALVTMLHCKSSGKRKCKLSGAWRVYNVECQSCGL